MVRSRLEREGGQATVEMALVLPLVVVLLLGVIQVGAVVRAQLLLEEAARSGARTAAVSDDPRDVVEAARATPGLDAGRLAVEIEHRGALGETVAVAVRYRTQVVVPLAGRYLPAPVLSARAVMRVES